ncbi:adenosylmethionine--8-amino-7-oxononanoate transaminase [Pseudodesulfovibrio alkaliphilus]|nr:adenosylmethionine--8-amino-7-oxononanoate transaminase [Pseudodesulfovibrio alkaliphilus]
MDKTTQALWLPVTQMKDLEEHPALRICSGKGIYLYDAEGKPYMDAISSWWTNIFGHANPRITRTLAEQAARLEHVMLAGVTHPPAEDLARRLTTLTPDELTRVFFAGDGASAVEIAMKMSYASRRNTGHTEKRRFVGLSGGYHGETLGALSLCGHDAFSDIFRPLMPDNLSVTGPDCYRCPHGKTRNDCDAECFEHMEGALEKHGREVTAVFIEPMAQGAAGWRFYSPRYLRKLRECTRHHDIHLVFDEIAVGFGRLGTMFAMEQAGVTPDFLTLSKSITSGTLPLSVVMTTDAIYEAFLGDFTQMKAFMHSHTYMGNPLACAVANETLSMFEEGNVLETNKPKYRHLANHAALRFADHRHVGEVRSLGFITCVELVSDRATKTPFDWRLRTGFRIFREALKRGVLLRNLGDCLYFLPPYVITQDEITRLVDVAHAAMVEILGE